jgi:hypothetical protein
MYAKVDAHCVIKTWIDICNKQYFHDSQNNAFWIDQDDLNYVYSRFYVDKLKEVVIRIPFEECIEAFKKVRNKYHEILLENFGEFLNLMESFKENINSETTS